MIEQWSFNVIGGVGGGILVVNMDSKTGKEVGAQWDVVFESPSTSTHSDSRRCCGIFAISLPSEQKLLS